MNLKKKSKALLSVVLVITLLMSVGIVGLASVSAADALAITYSYKYENAGYAEGRITLTAGSTADYGKYYLYWADDTKALEGYAPITSLNLNAELNYIEIGEFIAIPADATKLIAIKSSTEPTNKTVAAAQAVYEIPESKQFAATSSEKQYDFQALSDIHIQHDDSYWVYSKTHWANALEVAADRDVEFVTVCGDQVNGYGYSNLQKEWPQYLAIIADSSFTGPVFETNGNHEIKGNGGDSAQTQDHTIYKVGSGLNVETEAMQSNTYYEMTTSSGDHFIFMTLENSGAPNEYTEFSDAQLDWLEGLLNKYKNDGHKIIIFQHALIKGYGAGDDIENPYYGGGLNTEFADVQRFISLLEANKDVIWFSGHSHVDFKYNYNFNNMDGTSAYSVHIPSTSSTTHPNASTGSNDYIMSADSSQGYFVDMYEDYVVINGTDLVKNEILPLYTYLVDYTGEELVENDMPDKPVVNYNKVQVEVDVTALSDNPVAVKVMLYGADDETLTEEITMTKTADGTYAAEVSTQFTKMKFLVNGGSGFSSSGEYAVANCKVVLGGLKVKVSLADIKTKENASCTGWTVVNAYAWNSGTNQNAGAWPGTAMTKDTDGSYVILIPGGVNPDSIIFNNGTSQTADLSITPYIVAEYEGSYTVVGEETTVPETSVPETSVPETSVPETSVPETSAPETSVPETSVPETSVPETSSPVVEDYLYGDADLSGVVNVKDATIIQKYAADMLTLEGKAFIQANVSGDKAVNVRDATAIQKYVAGIIDIFPVEKATEAAEVGASATELSTLLSSIKTTLNEENYYASYVAYSNLKKAYYNYKDQTNIADVTAAYNEVSTALTDYNTMKANNPSHVNAGTSSSGSLGTGTTTNAISIDGTTTKPTDGAYSIRGSFNNWGNSGLEYMIKGDDGAYYISYELTAGTYEFKFFNADSSSWYGNSGTMNPGDSDWTFTDTGNCTLSATSDGVYTFKYYLQESTGKIKISLSLA